ncbi:Met-10+ like-protein-domain-containing protein [Collybia nuda]|uniref:tRNA (guanine(37)-N1)-methyltransferase n=1 Tax=Collybia nuda TaxID=64659 RepID=A0A9P6CKC1_9AGAR|nr:Met-10+ like-protein-domain-containing protein [Collybia nuda]
MFWHSCRNILRPSKLLDHIKMARPIFLDASPPPYYGAAGTLNKDAFNKSIEVLAARITPARTGSVLKAEALKRSIMDLPKIRSVVVDPSDPDGDRLVLLRVSKEAELTPEAVGFLRAESKGLVYHTIHLDYDYWTADEILQVILPEELREGSPTGFAATGHIAHINLNDEYLPYKYIIGQLILDKNKRIKTVVNKLDSIDTQFRFFKMELIAGEPEYVVEHYESGCRFTFDFTEVYWNSRLHTEHDRLVQMFKPQDVVVDVFAGVGPFAVPAAKNGCGVLANDLNPNSSKYLSINVENNRVRDLVRVSCEDGRVFIRSAVRRLLDDPFPAYSGPRISRTREQAGRRNPANILQTKPIINASRKRISHFVMNLPDSAITFLDTFQGVLSVGDKDLIKEVYDVMPMVHCHCFTRELEPDRAAADIKRRVEEKLGSELKEDVSLHLVRSVAPNKEMYCISFRLPPEVAFA